MRINFYYTVANDSKPRRDKLQGKGKALPSLNVGDHVAVQNQGTNHPRRWDLTGTVVEVAPHRQCYVRIDGSGRVTLRNRRFLRSLLPPAPASPAAHDQPTASMDVGGGEGDDV